MIKKVKLVDAQGNEIGTFDVGQLAAALAALLELSAKDNLNISSPKSINLEPTKHVKIKPGNGGQIELLPDHTGDLEEVLIKVQASVDENGDDLSSEKPVRLKINSAEIEFNTKGADDINEYDMKFKTGVKASASGEHYCQTKLKGRSFDLRCYEHGGIALQPCGQDGNNNENKIKFESSRISPIGEAGKYNQEGGKGLEFGTFNNEHVSLYTGDYRFKADGMVMAVTRGAIAQNASGKTDYPTQNDDFKDIPLTKEGSPCKWNPTNGWEAPSGETILSCTWEDIIKAVLFLKGNGSIS